MVTQPGNIASRRVIAACGGLLTEFTESFRTDLAHGGVEKLRCRIPRQGMYRED